MHRQYTISVVLLKTSLIAFVRRYAFPRNAGFGNQTALDIIAHDGLHDVYNKVPMGNCAEKVAKDYKITREDQDEFAINSYKKAAEAWSKGVFVKEIATVEIPDRKATIKISEDEEYKNIKYDKVKSLNPVFVRDGSGTITAANASNINDGASAVVLMSKEKAEEVGAKPLARIIGESFQQLPRRLSPDCFHCQPSRTVLLHQSTSP